MRRKRLHKSPLCVICESKGYVTEADIIDHIQPLALGGSDIDSNCRSLCNDCHDQVTRLQFGYKKRLIFDEFGYPINDEEGA